MCVQIISQGVVKKARKKHDCMASFWIRDNYGDLGKSIKMTVAEYREIIKAKQKNWWILKGESYIWQFNKDGGDTFKFKAIESIHKICLKYSLYPEC